MHLPAVIRQRYRKFKRELLSETKPDKLKMRAAHITGPGRAAPTLNRSAPVETLSA